MKKSKVNNLYLSLNDCCSRLGVESSTTLLNIAETEHCLQWGLSKIGERYKIHIQAILYYEQLKRKYRIGVSDLRLMTIAEAVKALKDKENITEETIKQAIRNMELYTDKNGLIPEFCLFNWFDTYYEI